MLEELAKKDKYWREVALKICKDKMLADDLVNDMYLKLCEVKKQINDFYVIITIQTIYYEYLRNKKKIVSINNFYDIAEDDNNFEVDDYQLELLDKSSKLSFVKLGLLKESYDLSIREIEKKYNINYGFIYLRLKEARIELLGDDINLYKNRRLKYNKNGKKKESNNN